MTAEDFQETEVKVSIERFSKFPLQQQCSELLGRHLRMCHILDQYSQKLDMVNEEIVNLKTKDPINTVSKNDNDNIPIPEMPKNSKMEMLFGFCKNFSIAQLCLGGAILFIGFCIGLGILTGVTYLVIVFGSQWLQDNTDIKPKQIALVPSQTSQGLQGSGVPGGYTGSKTRPHNSASTLQKHGGISPLYRVSK
jgi:hypothetical protein